MSQREQEELMYDTWRNVNDGYFYEQDPLISWLMTMGTFERPHCLIIIFSTKILESRKTCVYLFLFLVWYRR